MIALLLAAAAGGHGIEPKREDISHEVSYPEVWSGPCSTTMLLSAVAAEESLSLPEGLVVAVAMKESRCDPFALGALGEIGVMQIRPELWLPALCQANIACSEFDLWHAQTNIEAGAWILSTFPGGAWAKAKRYNGSAAYADDIVESM